MAANPMMMAALVTAAFEATGACPTPNDASLFRKGDPVVYPAHGVGRINWIGFEEIAGYRLNLIHISFEDNRMTLRVPVAQARASGLRHLASREALAKVLETMKGQPRASRVIWAKRSQEYLAKINTGHAGDLAEVLRDLQPAGEGSHSSFSQRNLFELALGRLAGEFAAVNNITKPDAMDMLVQTLGNAKAHSAAAPQQPIADA